MLASPERIKKERLVKKQKANSRSGKTVGVNFNLKDIEPITYSQELVFDIYDDGFNIMLHGSAGTGKTFIALYLALDSVINRKEHERVVIIRSIVPSREIGFLPGTLNEKIKVYELPYHDITTKLFGRGDAYEVLKTKHIIEFMPTSFVRGITMDNCVVVVDEPQNFTFQELDSVITRR